jgi:hypothetical protein
MSRRKPQPEFLTNLRSNGLNTKEVSKCTSHSPREITMEPTPEIKGRPLFIDIVGKFDTARDEPRVWLNTYIFYGQYLKLKDID